MHELATVVKGIKSVRYAMLAFPQVFNYSQIYDNSTINGGRRQGEFSELEISGLGIGLSGSEYRISNKECRMSKLRLVRDSARDDIKMVG